MLNEITPLTPATPTLPDLLGARIEYVHARPYAQTPMIENGTVQDYRVRGDKLHILVKPDLPHLFTRWRDADTDLLRYLPETQTAEAVIAPAAA